MANEIAKQYITEALAELVECRYVKVLGTRVLIRRWHRNINKAQVECLAYADAYISTANVSPASTITNPKADGEQFPGNWALLNNSRGIRKGAEDQAGITQALVLIPPNGLRMSFASMRSMVRCEDTTLHYGEPAPVPSPDSVRGGIYNATNSWNQETLTYEGATQYTQGKAVNWDFDQMAGHFEHRRASAYDDADQPLDAPGAVRGGVYDASSTINEFGLYDNQMAYRKGIPHQWTFLERSGPWRIRDRTEYRNGETVVDPPPDWSGPGMYDAANDLNDFLLYDSSLVYMYSSGLGKMEIASRRSARVNEQSHIYTDWNVPVEAPAGVRGGIYDASSSFSGDTGLYDGRLQYQTLKAGSWTFRSRSGRRRTHTRVGLLNQVAAIEAPVYAQLGGIYDADSRLNDGDLYDGNLDAVAAGAPITTTLASRHSGFETATTVLVADAVAPVEAPAGVRGGIYDADSNVTELGTYDNRQVYRAAIERRFAISERVGRFRTRSGVRYQNLVDPLEAPSGFAGPGVYDSQAQINEFALYDGARMYETRTGSGFSGSAIPTRHSTTQTDSEILYLDLASPVASVSVIGGVYDASNSVTDFGYDATLTYHAAVYWHDSYSFVTDTGTVWVYQARNVTQAQFTAAKAVLPFTAVTDNNLTKRPAEYPGLYDWDAVVRPVTFDGVGEAWDTGSWTHDYTNHSTGQVITESHLITNSLSAAKTHLASGSSATRAPGTGLRFGARGRIWATLVTVA